MRLIDSYRKLCHKCIKIMHYFYLLRLHQWAKNLLVFIPIFFAGEIFITGKLLASIFAFFSFSFAASAGYILNDIIDCESDKKNTKKKDRPLASGKISIQEARVLLAIMGSVAVVVAWIGVPTLLPLLGAYFLLNVSYTYKLKHIVIFDILVISIFYLMRVVGGGLVSSTPISGWLVLCIIFGSLFIIIGKRKAELGQVYKREVLQYYTANLLDHLLTISITLVIASYAMYSVLGVQSSIFVYSNIFVLMGIFRYLYLVYTVPIMESPEIAVFRDKVIAGSVLCWLLFVFVVFY